MGKMKGFLDRLPAPVRHAVIVLVGTFLGELVRAAAADGLEVLTSSATYATAGAAAVLATAAALGLLSGTAATTQYGVGARSGPDGPDVP